MEKLALVHSIATRVFRHTGRLVVVTNQMRGTSHGLGRTSRWLAISPGMSLKLEVFPGMVAAGTPLDRQPEKTWGDGARERGPSKSAVCSWAASLLRAP